MKNNLKIAVNFVLFLNISSFAMIYGRNEKCNKVIKHTDTDNEINETGTKNKSVSQHNVINNSAINDDLYSNSNVKHKDVITYKGKEMQVIADVDQKTGKLSDGTNVKLVCIKKGLIGMPNISDPSYIGSYFNKNDDKCYVYLHKQVPAKIDGLIEVKGVFLNVYINSDNLQTGKLSDGTNVKLVCIKKGLIGMPNISDPNYIGSYFNQSGDKCYAFKLVA